MRLKIFLIVFFISLPFWWGVNVFQKNLEDFLFWREMAENQEVLTSLANQEILEQKLRSSKPIRNNQVDNIQLEAKSAISVLLNKNKEKILFEKEIDKKLPIASLVKLMTAKVVLENYDISQVVKISKEAVQEEGEFGELKIGEVFRIRDLFYPLLMESSNDVAFALSEVIGEESFIGLMNTEAEELELNNTYFVNPTGLDPENSEDIQNYSTSEDLVKLTKDLLKNQPLIWEILSTSEFDLYSPDGVFHHKLGNTNKLLESEDFEWKIIGGKTGWTIQAQGCLLLVVRAPRGNGYLINIVLGSNDRFGEMEKLVNWVQEAHKW